MAMARSKANVPFFLLRALYVVDTIDAHGPGLDFELLNGKTFAIPIPDLDLPKWPSAPAALEKIRSQQATEH
jgi:hypothetical protein